LKDWPNESGTVNVSKITADLGVLQNGNHPTNRMVRTDWQSAPGLQINDADASCATRQKVAIQLTFVIDHTDREDFSWGLHQFRPYVLMTDTRR
jgi:hypothetical protein